MSIFTNKMSCKDCGKDISEKTLRLWLGIKVYNGVVCWDCYKKQRERAKNGEYRNNCLYCGKKVYPSRNGKLKYNGYACYVCLGKIKDGAKLSLFAGDQLIQPTQEEVKEEVKVQEPILAEKVELLPKEEKVVEIKKTRGRKKVEEKVEPVEEKIEPLQDKQEEIQEKAEEVKEPVEEVKPEPVIIVEEPKKKAPKTVPVKKEEENEEEDDEDDEDEEEEEKTVSEVFVDEDGNKYQIVNAYSMSFEARLTYCSEKCKQYFVDIVNYCMTFKKAILKTKWRDATIKAGRLMICRFLISGKSLCLLLPVEPDTVDPKLNPKMVSKKKYMATPCVIRLGGEASFKGIQKLLENAIGDLPKVKHPSNLLNADMYAEKPIEELLEAGVAKQSTRKVPVR